MPRTKEQLLELRAQQHEKILQATLKTVSHEGCAQTTIAKIAKTAGISKGLIYNYFDTKESIYVEILQNGFKELHLLINNDNPYKDKNDFIKMLDILFTEFTSNIDFWFMYYNFIMQPYMRERVNKLVAQSMEPMMRALSGYFERKGISDPFNEAILFALSLDGVFLGLAINPKAFDLNKLKMRIIEKFA